jgi:hypothetical protein
MFATLALRSIKCGQVTTYLPIYIAGLLEIGRFAPLFHASSFASGIFIYLFMLLFWRSYIPSHDLLDYSSSNLYSSLARLRLAEEW